MRTITANRQHEFEVTQKAGGVVVDVMSLLDNLSRVRGNEITDPHHLEQAREAAMQVAAAALSTVRDELNSQTLFWKFQAGSSVTILPASKDVITTAVESHVAKLRDELNASRIEARPDDSNKTIQQINSYKKLLTALEK